MQKTWLVLPPPPQDFFDAHPELPKIVSHLLYHRGLRTQEHIDEFLNPDYSEDIHDPFLFRDMKKAVERIFAAMEKGERITVYGDYDADGVSGATILTDGLRALGCANFSVFLPHRETDGYGVNMRAVDALKKEGTSLMITCDCGGSNTKEIAYANELGIDVIVTDHHTLPTELPPAFAMIHPKAPGETYPDQTLAGGGVAFKLIQALLKKHKETHETLSDGERHESLEKWSLDMAAIASVADMVPLLGESRTLTKYGLIVLNKTRRIGLQKLLLEARLMEQDGVLKKEINAETISFQLAPRINAAGRMNHASVAYNLMVTKDPLEATDLAFELNKNNQDRQRLSEELTKEAIAQVAAETRPILFALGNGWPIGLVGLIAGKLKEKFQKPAIVMTTHDNEITGSGRSIDAFNMIGAFQAIPECFVKFGGHPMACGFTVAPEKMEEFKQKLLAEFAQQTNGVDVSPVLSIDAEVALDDVTWELYDVLEKFAPFGQANPKPRYAAFGLTVVSLKSLGKDKRHLSLFAKHASKIKKFIGWNLCNSSEEGCVDWSKVITTGDKVDIVFEISVNEWNGNRELQLTIVDIKKSVAKNTDNADTYTDDADNADTIDEIPDSEEFNLIYGDLTYKINRILFEVHNLLGKYANEKQVCDAIEERLRNNNISYEREKVLPESFMGERSGRNRLDFMIENKIILEVKMINFVGKEEYFQCQRYLRACDKKLCLLANFRTKYLKVKRILNPDAKIITSALSASSA